MTAVLIVAGYSRRVFLNWLTGWSWSATLLVNQAIAPLIGLAIWTEVTGGRADVAAYYVAILVVGRFIAYYSAHTFSGSIYNGELTEVLLRPHPVVLGQLGWYIGISAFDALFAAPLIVAVAVLTPAEFELANVVLAVPATILAAAGAFCFDFAVGCTAFWTQRYFAASEAGGRLAFLFGGMAAPIPLLPESVRPWFSALPFRWIRGYPAEVAAGFVPRGEYLSGLAIQFGWMVALWAAAAFLLRAGVRRYTAIGG